MKRFNCILNDSEYIYYLNKNIELEQERIFCKHGLEHFLDTARIAYLINLENKLEFPKEIIYVTAILHDIGRALQYEDGIPHEIASWNIGKKLLEKYKFTDSEIKLIKEAILGHRDNNNNEFTKLIYKADKLSRTCINCKAIDECNWNDEKKNLEIYY